MFDKVEQIDKAVEVIQGKEHDIEAIKTSLSYKLGMGLTSPLRWIYDKTRREESVSKSKLWLIQQLIKSGVKNPGETLKNLTPGKIKTLSEAIRKEPPHLIAENFKKLVDQDAEDVVLKLGSEDVSTETNQDKKQKILFISPHLPDYDNSSGGKRATRMLELLSEDFEVYAFTLGNKPEKYVKKLNESGVIVIGTRDYRRIKKTYSGFHSYHICLVLYLL